MQCKWQIEFKFHNLIMRESWAAQFYTLQRLYPVPTSHVTRLPWGCTGPIHLYQGSEKGNTTRPLQSSTSFQKPATVRLELC
jgi:hypothetical protein